MGRLLKFIIVSIVTFSASVHAIDINDLQKLTKSSDRKVANFVKSEYRNYSDTQPVELCYTALKEKRKDALNAMYNVLLFLKVTEGAMKAKEPELQIKRNRYRLKLIPHYQKALETCNKEE